MFKSFLIFTLFFSLLFVGEFDILGIHLFYIFWILLIIFRYYQNIKFTFSEILSQVIIFTFYLFPILRELIFYESYSNAYIQMILFINVIPIINYVFKNKSCEFFYISLIVQTLFFFASLYGLIFTSFDNFDTIRTQIIFGPNVLYRIYTFLFAISLITFGNLPTKKIHLLFYIFLIFIFNLLLTGSRGAVLAFLMLISIIFYNKNDFKYFTKYLKYIIIIFPVLIFIYFDILSTIFWRLLYFSFENGSEGARLEYYNLTLNFLQDNSIITLLTGASPTNIYFDFYPHNILLETLVYSGLIPFVFLFFSIIYLISNLITKKHVKEYLLFSGIIAGSIVSGSLYENFYILTLPIYFACEFLFNKNNNFNII